MGEPVPHPWNTSFTWQSPQPPYRRVTGSEAAQFDREGWFVVDRLVDDPTLGAVTDEIDRREAKVEAFLRTQPDERMSIAEAGALDGVDPSRRPLARPARTWRRRRR